MSYADKRHTPPACIVPECTTETPGRKLVLIAGRPQWVCEAHQPEEA